MSNFNIKTLTFLGVLFVYSKNCFIFVALIFK
nr:MAG TPA: hypothetical protein [Caudoviricetes sp.]DAM45030.1 MAG TPA: hypothetical protein [Caudoviricetes sp.]